ncbi:MAG TPA: TonB-dependent receptor [Hyphomonadaceae bacterium]|nr:TonB-dependent receptor [Hyphomonadaceae bacterium]HPN05080.1 TonB-dependent receptor [Hyphomonadaceae bacterium]
MAQLNRISLVSLLALGIAMPAMAQQTPQEPEKAEPGRDVVVVTANKREETVQDIAVAVTAVTAETREEIGIRTITDLTNLTPGLSYTAGNERITLRGVGRNTNNFGAEPGVANYTDGIYQSFASIAGRDNLFVDRIEVLRGPQGTLYGRNSIGGALNIISKRPTDEFKGEFLLGFGNYDSAKAGFSLSGPIAGDWLRGRVVGFQEQRGEGVFKNYGTGETEGYNVDNNNWEVQLEGDIGDRFSWWTKYTAGKYNNAGPPGGRTTPNSNAPYDKNSFGSLSGTGAINPNPYWALGTDPRKLGYTMLGSTTENPALRDPFSVNDQEKRNARTDHYNDFALEAIYEAGPFDVKYVGGYIYYNYVLTGDQDGSPIQSITYNSTSFGAPAPVGTAGSAARTIFPDLRLTYNENRAFFSNELNFISTYDSPLQWIAGIYAYQENFAQPVKTYFPNEPLASAPGILALNASYVPIALAAPNPERLSSYTNNKGLNNSYGVFVQTDWSFMDDWKLTTGLRYSVDNKHIQEEARLFCFIQCSFAPGYSPYTDVTRAIWNGASSVPGMQPGVTSATPANPSGVTYNPLTGNAERLLEDEWDAVTGTAGLEWTPTTDTLLFAKYSRGYKTGGFNATDMAPRPRTGQEIVNSYELGWKQEIPDYNLTANMAAFFYDYQDVQVPLSIDPDGDGPALAYTGFINVPKVETTGFELESTWRPMDDMVIRFTYSYLNAEIKESGAYVNTLCVPLAAGATIPADQVGSACPLPGATSTAQSVEGNMLPQSPHNKIAINANYVFNFEDGSTLMPSVSYYWRDKFYSSLFNDDRQETKAYGQTDARLIWNDSTGTFTVIGWVRNAFDEEGFDLQTAFRQRSLDPANNNRIYQNTTYTLPRTYGVELQVHF